MECHRQTKKLRSFHSRHVDKQELLSLNVLFSGRLFSLLFCARLSSISPAQRTLHELRARPPRASGRGRGQGAGGSSRCCCALGNVGGEVGGKICLLLQSPSSNRLRLFAASAAASVATAAMEEDGNKDPVGARCAC